MLTFFTAIASVIDTGLMDSKMLMARLSTGMRWVPNLVDHAPLVKYKIQGRPSNVFTQPVQDNFKLDFH